jgi:hypothetical protein
MASWKAYSEVNIIASDKEQAADRVLKVIKYACNNRPLANHVEVFLNIIELDNQSIIRTPPSDWQGAAGGNQVCRARCLIMILVLRAGAVWHGCKAGGYLALVRLEA